MKKLLTLVLVLALVFTCVGMVSAEEEITKITWVSGSSAVKDNQMILDYLNEHFLNEMGIELDIQYYDSDATLRTDINNGTVFDIYFTCSWYNNTNQAISDGLFVGLDPEVIKEEAPGLWAALPESVWETAASADGKIYAIPNWKDYAAENFITYPADIAKELGYEIPEKISAWGELTDFLVDWKATLADGEYPVLVGGNPAGLESSFDFIDRTAMVGCIFGTTEVKFVFDDPEVMERYETMAEWMKLGLINPDAAQLTENAIDSSKPHIGFAQAWDGYDGYTVSNGYLTYMTRYAGPQLSVDTIQGSMNAFGAHLANDPDKLAKCLQLFELIHTNKLFADCLRYGVPGYHWNYVDAEKYPDFAGGVLRTQEGKDNGGCPWAFAQPAYFFTSIAVGDPEDPNTQIPNFAQYDQYLATIAAEGKISAMGGFKMDTSEWKEALAQFSAIKDSYYKGFASGTTPIDEVKDEFLAKMNAAGLQEFIADAQKQLDEYLANQ